MARRIANRKELRAAAEAAEASEKAKPKAKRATKTTKKRVTTRKTKDKEIRLKAFWAVFDHALKRVALFDYGERKEADKKAAELTEKKKRPHFVQQVKEPIEE